MKKIGVFGIIVSLLFGVDAMSAVAARSSARAARTPANQTVNSSANTKNTNRRAAPRAAVSQKSTSATSQNVTSGASKKVDARAATTQKVINSGTKIAGATNNTVVNEECRTKYYGCMDSFCMMDNANGGRCLCSDRNVELDKVLADIQKLDEQSYAMATTGVERIQMGDDADAVQQMVDKITNSVQDPDEESKNKKTKARTLNLDAWNDEFNFEQDDELFTNATSEITDQTGDALHSSVSDICVKQIPECSANFSMLKMMYAQQIKSDCAAYENSLKQQKSASAKKLQTAQTALREAALEQHQNANKYDLGQCTIRFKQCMQTTAECGEDFSKCASVVASENAQTKVGKKQKTTTYDIDTGMTTISIAASTYDILMSKKPICDSVTKQCTSVKDKVWETFLRESAATIKSAELVAESNLRMSCISNISSCFQQACKDNMDSNDPDGSYDMCLSRPETMRSLCKVQIDPCVASEPKILDYVYARLASMRVDSCTKEVKECLQSEDRCGSDYSNCIGLDLIAIRDMCPLTKLVGCQENGQEATWETIDNIVQGVYLDIDNSLLNTCTNLVNTKIVEICGDSNSCDIFANDPYIGTGSIVVSRDGSGNYVMDGLISFDNLVLDSSDAKLNVSEYVSMLKKDKVNDKVIARIQNTLTEITNAIDRQVVQLSSDPKISMCIEGRDMSQISSRKDKSGKSNTTARFPNILHSYKTMMATAALKAAKTNYDAEYAKYFTEAMSGGDEYKNQLYCMAMAQGSDFTSGISNLKDAGIKESSLARLVIYGETNEKMLKAITENKEKVKIHTDSEDSSGRMIAREEISSVYEPGTKICRITSKIYPCTGFESIYNSSSEGYNFGVGATVAEFGGDFSMGHSESDTTYQGNFCSSFSEPVISEQIVNMDASGEYLGTNSTRSNLTSYYNDQSSYTHTEDKGVSIGLSTGSFNNVGNGNNNGNTTNKTVNKNSGNTNVTTN